MRLREKSGASFLRPLGRSLAVLLKHPFAAMRARAFEIMFGLTERCQCACVHCGVRSQKQGVRPELTTAEAQDLIGQAARLPFLFCKISFFGGEPLLRDDIFHLIRHASKKGLFTDMNSNGVMLFPENVARLKKSGLHHVYVSLDSADPAQHDSLRGFKDCYRKATEGIKNCTRLGLPCSVSAYVSRRSLSEGGPEAIINEARLLGAVSVRLLYPLPSGNWHNNPEERLSEEEKQKLRLLLRPDFVYLEATDCCAAGARKACAAVQKKFAYISPAGDLQLCPFLDAAFGNVRELPLEGLLERMWRNGLFHDRNAFSCPAERM